MIRSQDGWPIEAPTMPPLSGRWHSASRWPNDDREREELAKTTLIFCHVLGSILFPDVPRAIPTECCDLYAAAQRLRKGWG